MKIETKFNIGDEIFFMDTNKIKNRIIRKLSLTMDEKFEQSVMYYYIEDDKYRYISEKSIFATKQELLDSL